MILTEANALLPGVHTAQSKFRAELLDASKPATLS